MLIERWVPVAELGVESRRERGASSALPPLYFLHVWWARRPLTMSRAAVLASLLPDSVDEQWFLRTLGITGDPVAERRQMDEASEKGERLKQGFSYPRAFTHTPPDDELRHLHHLIRRHWQAENPSPTTFQTPPSAPSIYGDEIIVLDPMAGGGSIPLEAVRCGCKTYAAELNPVACVILKATLDYPARFGPELAREIRHWGGIVGERARERLEPFFPRGKHEQVWRYLWACTVRCPECGLVVPLSPNWWLAREDNKGTALRLVAPREGDTCSFDIATIDGRTNYNPSLGTVARGVGKCPRDHTVPGDYIKAEAQAGRMGQQLCALAVKNAEGRAFRPPTEEDVEAAERAAEALAASLPRLLAEDLVPTEEFPEVSSDPRPRFYGMPLWRDMFSPRQLLGHAIYLEEIRRVKAELFAELPRDRAEALAVYLALIFDKSVDYNSQLGVWHPTRQVIAHAFDRHDFSFKWSFAEWNPICPGLGYEWAVDQIADAYEGIAALTHKAANLFGADPASSLKPQAPSPKITVTLADAAEYRELPDGSVHLICVDPPYYENVMYAELSDFFYVWEKRTLGDLFPDWFSSQLVEKEREAVANPARFRGLPGSARTHAESDYEAKMRACFTRMRELLRPEGVLTVMFNHKKVEAWDTLASALIGAGFEITASWPVRTESEHSLHQARKNACNSTVLLVCRRRQGSGVQSPESGVWWEDALPRVRDTVRERVERFEELGITGVDLMLSTFGPALQVISSRWPVRSRSGEEVRPDVALDEARRVVTEYRMEKLLREHRQAGLDPATLWTILAWDIYRAETFPFGEAHTLAIATGVHLDQQIFRRHLAAKSGSNVQLLEPGRRRRRSQVDPEADEFGPVIDALHTAIWVWQEDGAAGCRRLFDRTGLLRREEFADGVQAMLNALPQARPEFLALRGIAQQFLSGRVEVPEEQRLTGIDNQPDEPEEEGE